MKLDIRRKVLLLVLSGSLLTFMLMTVFFAVNMIHARKAMDDQTEELANGAAEYAAEMLEAGIKKRLEEITRVRTQGINNGLTKTAADVKHIAGEMSDLLQKGVRFSAEPVPNALYIDVPAGRPFILYSPTLVKQGISAPLQKEIDRASGIAGLLVRMSGYYPNVFVGSKNGYFLMVQEKGGDNTVSYFCKDSIRNSYDPRERSWYKLGRDVSEPVFTDAYLDAGTGDLCVSAVMPYYDANGFAGVVGLDCSIQDLYAQIMETAISSNEHSFILGKKGEVIVSSKKEGVLSVSRESSDLRQLGDTSLALEAARMRGKHGGRENAGLRTRRRQNRERCRQRALPDAGNVLYRQNLGIVHNFYLLKICKLEACCIIITHHSGIVKKQYAQKARRTAITFLTTLYFSQTIKL